MAQVGQFNIERIPRFSLKSAGTTTVYEGIDPRKTGSINLHNVLPIMDMLRLVPKSESWRAAIDKGSRVLSNLDLRDQYGDQVVDLGDLITRITAANINSRNRWLYTTICPMRFTNQFNFTTSTTDVYQAPYDEMSPLNIARVTGWKREFQSYTLKMYKRSQEAEWTLLADPQNGPMTMQRMISALDTQAELTLMKLISDALVEYPFMELIKRRQHPVNSFSHSREMLMESSECYMAARHRPSEMMTMILREINDGNNIDTLVIPGGAGARLITMEGAPRPVMGYLPFFDTASGTWLARQYATGQSTFKTIPNGNGTGVDVFEMVPFQAWANDDPGQMFNPLETHLTLGEVIEMPEQNLDDLLENQVPLVPKLLDVVAPSQTAQSMDWERLKFREYLKYNVLFLNEQGTSYLSDKGDGLSTYYQTLATKYNEEKKKGDVKNSYRSEEHRDNNVPWRDYLRQNRSMADMDGYRHFDGFLSYNDVSEQIEVPVYVGDIEPKTLPPREVWKMAEVLAQHLVAKVEGDTKQERRSTFGELLRNLLPHSRFLRSGAEPDNLADILDASRWERVGDDDRPFMGAAVPSLFSSPPNSPFAPRENESKEEYISRLTPDAISAAIENGDLDGKDNAWLHMLQHVPDSGLASFLSLVYGTHKNGLADEDHGTLAKLTKDLETKSGQEHVSELLKSVNNAVQRAQGSPINVVFKERGNRPWLNSAAEARANSAVNTTTDLAESVKQHIADVMGRANLGAVGDTSRGAIRRFAEDRFSWRLFNEMLRDRSDAHDTVKATYVAILQCPFNWYTCDRLASVGLTLFYQDYVRMFIEQNASAFVALHAGFETWFMAYGHGQVLSGVGSAEGSFALHAQMHLGIIPMGLTKAMRLYPYAMPNGHVSGRTLDAIRHREDLDVAQARDRRCVIVLPRPLTETNRTYPISAFRENIYEAQDTEAVLYAQKTSWTDILTEFLTPETVEEAIIQNDNFAQYFHASLSMATHLHRAAAGYPANTNPQDRQWHLKAGTGVLGALEVNYGEQSVRAFAGLGSFAEVPPVTTLPM